MFPSLASRTQGGQDPRQKSSSNLHWGSQIPSEGDQVSPQEGVTAPSPVLSGGQILARVPRGMAHLDPISSQGSA